MPKFRDLTGQKFNRWTVLEKTYKKYAEHIWLCVCECGTKKEVIGSSLKQGRSKSCGCYSVEVATKHGMEGTPTYNTWGHMMSRCNNKNHKQYKDYGGRGIYVCERWWDFSNFYADMGLKPEGMSIDRIDNNGPYSQENCRWASQKEQIRNRRVSPKFEYKGTFQSLAEICEGKDISWRRVYERIRAGWDIAQAVETPIRKKHNELIRQRNHPH